MPTVPTIEERLAALEKQMAELKQRLGLESPRDNWLQKVTGSFKDDPEFDEIVRLGREFREAQREPES